MISWPSHMFSLCARGTRQEIKQFAVRDTRNADFQIVGTESAVPRNTEEEQTCLEAQCAVGSF
jgi:hypothetical protein